jgi:hypothetical protein
MVIDLQPHTTAAPGVTSQTRLMPYVQVFSGRAFSEVAGQTAVGETVLPDHEALSTQERADRFRSQIRPLDPSRFVE